jgi:hypothetical protein
MIDKLTTYRYDMKQLQPFLVTAKGHIDIVVKCHKRFKERMVGIIQKQ